MGVNAPPVINNFFLGHDMLVTELGISGYGTKKGEVRQEERAMKVPDHWENRFAN